MTPIECERHYEETGNSSFYGMIEIDNKEVEVIGKIDVDMFGCELPFRSRDCERLGLDMDEIDWFPW